MKEKATSKKKSPPAKEKPVKEKPVKAKAKRKETTAPPVSPVRESDPEPDPIKVVEYVPEPKKNVRRFRVNLSISIAGVSYRPGGRDEIFDDEMTPEQRDGFLRSGHITEIFEN